MSGPDSRLSRNEFLRATVVAGGGLMSGGLKAPDLDISEKERTIGTRGNAKVTIITPQYFEYNQESYRKDRGMKGGRLITEFPTNILFVGKGVNPTGLDEYGFPEENISIKVVDDKYKYEYPDPEIWEKIEFLLTGKHFESYQLNLCLLDGLKVIFREIRSKRSADERDKPVYLTMGLYRTAGGDLSKFEIPRDGIYNNPVLTVREVDSNSVRTKEGIEKAYREQFEDIYLLSGNEKPPERYKIDYVYNPR